MIDLNSLASGLWLMDIDRLLAMQRLALRDLRNLPSPEDLAAARQTAAAAMRAIKGKVAVFPIQGVIEHRMSMWGYFYGSFSTELGEQVLAQLLAARDVEAIVLDIDSPGGTSYGTEEFAEKLYEARAVKPIYAVANSMAASAAYWIASAATQIAVTPGGDVGSIGVYAMHVDYSQALAEAGIKVTIAKAGKYKAELNPYEPLTEEARDYLQESVDDTYTKFTKAVARNRGVSVVEVRDKFGQGRVLPAEKAKAVGMADRVLSLSALLERLGGSGLADLGKGRRSSAEVLRLRHARQKSLQSGLA